MLGRGLEEAENFLILSNSQAVFYRKYISAGLKVGMEMLSRSCKAHIEEHRDAGLQGIECNENAASLAREEASSSLNGPEPARGM